MAEYIGGTCSIVPEKLCNADSKSARVAFTFRVSSTSPVISSVSVTVPSLKDAIYALSCDGSSSQKRVAPPSRTGRTPVAMGSSVPVCPVF